MIDFKEAAQKVIDGEVDPIVTYAEMKQYKKDLDESLKIIEDVAREEALKFGEKNFVHKGWKIEVRNGATRYSFKNIQEWNDKQKELKDLEAKYKHAYQSAQKGLTTLSEDEILQLPETTTSKESIIIKPA